MLTHDSLNRLSRAYQDEMTDLYEELNGIAKKLEKLVARGSSPDIKDPLQRLSQAADNVGKASSGSWIGYHANVYYQNLQTPPPGAHFNPEWGLMPLSFVPERTTGDWVEYDPDRVRNIIFLRAGNPDIKPAEEFKESANTVIDSHKASFLSIIEIASSHSESQFLTAMREASTKLKPIALHGFFDIWKPVSSTSRDSKAIHQKTWMPPHAEILARVASIQRTIDILSELAGFARQLQSHIQRQARQQQRMLTRQSLGTQIFIGHGRSHIWRALKDFLEDDLGLLVDEFNRIPTAGASITGRLETMLNSAAIAFLVMTGEDEQPSGELRARENVVHEAGLFQGRLGFERAVVLLEAGCEKFSNNAGLGHIPFPKDNIRAAFQDIREVLEREGIVHRGNNPRGS